MVSAPLSTLAGSPTQLPVAVGTVLVAMGIAEAEVHGTLVLRAPRRTPCDKQCGQGDQPQRSHHFSMTFAVGGGFPSEAVCHLAGEDSRTIPPWLLNVRVRACPRR
jgi:hypothetical protein